MRIRKGDTVEVISGDHAGKQGKVLSLSPRSHQVIVEGINFMKRHSKPSQQNPQGGIVEKEAPIHVSNVMIVASGNRTRIGHRLLDSGKKIRVAVTTGQDIDS
ncbi:MAG: 50S ribosomal protein L24 [Candidatus Marinimicrobia bacterium]|nr:50S ribosomal protein L24 [Candidatus Neomarinimicrobiota bacterium]|tara:strand:+ start:1229 stop:1537 length:309 start_codon:yes stop_codon:yes gene_type:complete